MYAIVKFKTVGLLLSMTLINFLLYNIVTRLGLWLSSVVRSSDYIIHTCLSVGCKNLSFLSPLSIVYCLMRGKDILYLYKWQSQHLYNIYSMLYLYVFHINKLLLKKHMANKTLHIGTHACYKFLLNKNFLKWTLNKVLFFGD